ncbi:MAG: amidase [Myxococcales bacterium]|nr:amidase [Myxococcales bacterium]MCB9714593.1 amidase [Myxococcales bacterium]
MDAREYLQHDATALAELVREGEVTPAELLERAIAQIETHNPRINAVVCRMFDTARAAVAQGLPDGPFRGVPFLLKDLVADHAGVPTTAGSRFFARFVPESDSELVRRYKAAGLVIVGKTNTPEMGLMGVTEPELHGPTRNPYHVDHTPGGSSGGSAAAVAARLVPAAHGGDGGGSIRIPAAACGLVGLKPTRGRVPMGPDACERWSGYVAQHVITRSVRDSAGLLDATAGPEIGSAYHAPPIERPFAEEVGRDPGRLRIAFTTEALLLGELHPECREAVERTASTLSELGHDVEPARPRFDAEAMAEAYLSTVAANVCAELMHAEHRLGRRPQADELELATWVMREIGRTLGAGRLVELQQLQAETAWAMARFHQRYDLLLTATFARPPARVGELLPGTLERVGLRVLRRLPLRPLLRQAFSAARKQLAAYPNTQIFNITGQPAISVPTHLSADGLPVGVQLVARFGDEATLLRVASQLETELGWTERRPSFLES